MNRSTLIPCTIKHTHYSSLPLPHPPSHSPSPPFSPFPSRRCLIYHAKSFNIQKLFQVCLFTGYPVKQTLYLRSGVITDFNTARTVFLRATARIEELKKIFVLDGEYRISSDRIILI